jgi:hypothetical protein
VNVGRVAATVDGDYWTTLAMSALPVAAGKFGKRMLDARMEFIAELLDAILFTPCCRSFHSFRRRDAQNNRKIGNPATGSECIRCPNLGFWKSPSVNLIGVRRKEKPVHHYNYTACERRVNLVVDELCPGRHEQQGFRGRSDVLRGVEKQSADGVTKRGAAWLPQRENFDSVSAQRIREEAKLSGLARAL